MNDHAEISAELESVLKRYLKNAKADQPLDPSVSLASLGLDSMASINMMLDLETTFNVIIPDEMLTAEVFETAGSLQRALSSIMVK